MAGRHSVLPVRGQRGRRGPVDLQRHDSVEGGAKAGHAHLPKGPFIPLVRLTSAMSMSFAPPPQEPPKQRSGRLIRCLHFMEFYPERWGELWASRPSTDLARGIGYVLLALFFLSLAAAVALSAAGVLTAATLSVLARVAAFAALLFFPVTFYVAIGVSRLPGPDIGDER